MSESTALVEGARGLPPRQAPATPARPLDVAVDTTSGRGSVTQLLHAAIQKGATAADLKELVALHERIADREAAEAFARAMAEFQAECPAIHQGSTAKIATKGGGSYSFTYAELEDIVEVVRPIAARHGFSFTWESVSEGGMLTTICIVRHKLGASSRTPFTVPIENPSAMNPQQKSGAALTFAQRRTLLLAFGIVTTETDPASVRAVDPTPINDDQFTTLQDLLHETKTDSVRFLKHFDIETLPDLPAARYAEAVATLNEKKRRGGV